MVALMRKAGNAKGQTEWLAQSIAWDGGDSSSKIIGIITARKGVKNKKVKHRWSEKSAKI